MGADCHGERALLHPHSLVHIDQRLARPRREDETSTYESDQDAGTALGSHLPGPAMVSPDRERASLLGGGSEAGK